MPDIAGVSGDRLKMFIDRIERLENEKKGISEDIKEVYGEAKAVGYDPKIIRKVIRLRNMDNEKRREEEELIDLYLAALGDIAPPAAYRDDSKEDNADDMAA